MASSKGLISFFFLKVTECGCFKPVVSRLRQPEGDLKRREPWGLLWVPGEGGNLGHELLYDVVEHVGAEGVLPPDAKGLVETLHRGCEVIGESLHVAQGREGGEVQGGQHQGLLVEGDVDGEGPGMVGVSLDDPTAKFK